MEILQLLDTGLDVLGYIVLGYWILQFIFFAYVKGYEIKEPPRQQSNIWDYM